MTTQESESREVSSKACELRLGIFRVGQRIHWTAISFLWNSIALSTLIGDALEPPRFRVGLLAWVIVQAWLVSGFAFLGEMYYPVVRSKRIGKPGN